MSSEAARFSRPSRVNLPELPEETVEIPAPPAFPPPPSLTWLTSIIPFAGIGVMALFYLARVSDNASSLFTALPLLVIALLTLVGTFYSRRRQQQAHQKECDERLLNYIRVLESRRVRLQAAYDAQMAALRLNFPSPEAQLERLLTQPGQGGGRRPTDADFACFRLGIGDVPSRIRVQVADSDHDHDEISRAFALADSYRLLRDAPVLVRLSQAGSVALCGSRERILPAVRAALCHLAGSHAPQDMLLYLIAAPSARDDWRWMEWLPHTSPSYQGGTGDLLMFETEHVQHLLGNLSQMVDERRERPDAPPLPHLVLVIDGPGLIETEVIYATLLREGYTLGISVLCLSGLVEQVPGDCRAIVDVYDDGLFRYALTGMAGGEIVGRALDSLSYQDAEHIARSLSPVSAGEGASGRIPRRVDFLDLYGTGDASELREKIAQRWRRGVPNGVLPHAIPIGRESLTLTTELLLDEDHHGPHGVLAGTTGSGKSELLQSLVCALALEHDPRLLNLLLIDFKGGSTFNGFVDLPHTVGTVTNLDGLLVERALEALKAEVRSRQQFLKQMNVRDVTQYHRFFARTDAHLQDASYQPLPHLFIIVDEYAQLAREMPDFLRELVRIAQVGRSLGLHLILGTQSPMDVITDEMNANLQFRICLRVQNIEASRAVLRRPDAAYLPAGWAGRGYLQVGERGLFKQFQTAYAGGDYRRRGEDDHEEVLELVLENGEIVDLLGRWSRRTSSILADEPYTTARAICEVIREYAAEQRISPAPPLLLPPLEEQVGLNEVFKRAKVNGWNGHEWLLGEVLPGSAPIGLIDDIYKRTQEALWVHLNAGQHDRDGHLLIVGGPGSGKTMLLQTLALSLAFLHPPDQLHLYFLSLTGSGLNGLGELPHAERVVQGTETERVRRLFGRLIHTLNERQAGRARPFEPTIVLFIDPYEPFRDSFYEKHVADFERLIQEGRAVGIYLVVTSSSIGAIPERVRSLIPQRIALQLGNTADYTPAVGAVQMRLEGRLAKGRGFAAGQPPLMCQIALPSREVNSHESLTADDSGELIDKMRLSWGGQTPAPLRELPTRILFSSPAPLPQPETGGIQTLIGQCDDDALSAYTLDWEENGPHFVVIGPAGSGKTNLLHLAVLSAARSYSPQQVRFLLVDFSGRSLRALDGLQHVIARVSDWTGLQEAVSHLSAELETFYVQWKENPQTVFPKTVIVIDDYDMTAEILGAHGPLLQQLRDLARLYSEQGLHIWAAGYLERASDPLIRQLLLRRSGFGLSVRESLHPLNVRTAGLPNDVMPEGRAYFVQHHVLQAIQTLWVEDVGDTVREINRVWRESWRADWVYPEGAAQTAQNAPKPIDDLTIDTDGLLSDLLGDD